MGFFKKIKQMFSKNIDCSDILVDKTFYLYATKKREIRVGANIIVPADFYAVFVCKDKVCDTILSGKFEINGANLPKTFSTLKLGKANKKGKYKKKFLADIYFLSKKCVKDNYFSSYGYYVNNSAKVGKIKARSEGQFDFEIVDAGKLLKYMLSERAYIEEEMFFDVLGGLVGNYINVKLEALYDEFIEILLNPKLVNERLNVTIEMEEHFEDYGFKLSNVRFESFNVSSAVKSKVNDVLKREKPLNDQINRQINIEIPVLKEVSNIEGEITAKKEPQKCSGCGHLLRKESLFCEKCGKKIDNLN